MGKVGLAGDRSHVAKSLSPKLFAAAFRASGLTWTYEKFPIEGGVSELKGVLASGIRGLNVTAPLKTDVIQLCDGLDDLAERIGAVNTVDIKDGTARGYNTDVGGFRDSLERWGYSPAGDVVCVLGAGGAARAVVAATSTLGPAEVRVVARSTSAAKEVARSAQATTLTVVTVDWEARESALRGADLLVNATPVGQDGEVIFSPGALEGLGRVIDLTYGRKTALVRDAERSGAKAVDGRPMLVCQAARSFEIWTGRKAPLDVMWDVMS